MFQNVPKMRLRFHQISSGPFSQLVNDQNFLDHARKVIITLDQFVTLLNDPIRLEASMRRLAHVHLTKVPPVGSYYFDVFSKNFHTFIEKRMDLPEEDRVVQLWVKLIDTLCEIIREEEAKALDPQEVSKRKCCTIL